MAASCDLAVRRYCVFIRLFVSISNAEFSVSSGVYAHRQITETIVISITELVTDLKISFVSASPLILIPNGKLKTFEIFGDVVKLSTREGVFKTSEFKT